MKRNSLNFWQLMTLFYFLIFAIVEIIFIIHVSHNKSRDIQIRCSKQNADKLFLQALELLP